MGPGRASPDPGLGVAIEMLSRAPGHISNIVIIGQRLSCEGFAPEDPPPALDQIQPRRSHWNEGVLNAGMGVEPFPDRPAGVAGQVVGDQVQVPARIGVVQRLPLSLFPSARYILTADSDGTSKRLATGFGIDGWGQR